MAGNFIIGLSIIAPAGIIAPLAADLAIPVTQAALVITIGAIVLCLGSPLAAWGASTVDRRTLLSAALAMLALCHAASAFAPDFTTVLAIRIVAMGFACVFTPQAASAIAMLVPERERPGAISFVFLGWSLSAAAGLPLVAWSAAEFGWRSVHLGLAVGGALAAGLVALSLPSGLRGGAMSLASWGGLFRTPMILVLLAATILSSAGQFLIFTFFGPLLAITIGATPAQVAACFAVFGIAGFLGNVAASRVVGRLGALRTSLVFFSSMVVGATLWAIGGSLAMVLVASAVWGAGFAASNSMQQARLAAAAPALAGAAIALNSSSIYIGQATGSALGGVMFGAGLYQAMGLASAALLALTVLLVYWSGRLGRAAAR